MPLKILLQILSPPYFLGLHSTEIMQAQWSPKRIFGSFPGVDLSVFLVNSLIYLVMCTLREFCCCQFF